MPVALSPPPEETEDAIMRLVVREYPRGGADHERAIRLAVRLAWPAAIGTTAQLKETING